MFKWIKSLFAKKVVLEPIKPVLTKETVKSAPDKHVSKPLPAPAFSTQPNKAPIESDLTDPLDPLSPIGLINPISPISPFHPMNSAPIETPAPIPECRPAEHSSPSCSDHSSSSYDSSSSYSSSYDGGSSSYDGGGGGFD